MQIDQVTISKGASEDIAALTRGQDRTTVALNALKDAGDLTPRQRTALQGIAARYEAKVAAETQVEQKLAVFIATYKIRAIEGEASQVAQTIPTDKTFADFLGEGQALSIRLHAAFPDKYTARQAIWPERLKKLLSDPAFRGKGTGKETITDGCVPGTNGRGMTRDGATQKLASQGLSHEAAPVLVAAHTGRYLLDASSIFKGQVVRAADGAFYFRDYGLNASDGYAGHGSDVVSSSARRGPQELEWYFGCKL